MDNQRRRRRLRKRMDGVMKDVGNGAIASEVSETTSTEGSGGSMSIPTSLDISLSNRSLNTNTSNLSANGNVNTEKFDVRYDHVMIREYRMMPGDNPRYVCMVFNIICFRRWWREKRES